MLKPLVTAINALAKEFSFSIGIPFFRFFVFLCLWSMRLSSDSNAHRGPQDTVMAQEKRMS